MPYRHCLIACSLLWLPGAAAPVRDGIFARDARPLWSQVAGSSRPLVTRSPDGRTRIVARYREAGDDGHVVLAIAGRMGSGTVALGPGVNSELLWAGDSRAFAVTTSDAGSLGPYRTIVVSVGSGGRLTVRDLSPIVHRASTTHCDPPEAPNVGAVAWEAGSARIVVAGEVVPHSSCRDMGSFRAYRIDRRTGRILAHFDQDAARRQFGGALGRELRGVSGD